MRLDPTWKLLTAALGLTVLSACATYRPHPLPPPQEVAAQRMPDLERLKVEAARLHHPILKPVTLDLSDGLTPDEAAVLAVLANPDLKAVRDAHGEAAAQLIGAGVLPNPVFSGEVDHPYGAGSESTVNATNFSLEMDVGSLIGRAARVAEASANLQAVDLGIAWQEWQVAQAARLATVRLAMLERRLRLVKKELAFESETVSVLEEAVDKGDATVQDLGVHRSAVASLTQLEGDLESTAAETRSSLDLLTGLPPDADVAPVVPEQSGRSFPPLPTAQELVDRAVTSRLDLKAFQLGYQAQEARVHQAVLAQFPSLSIGIDKQRNETALHFLGGLLTLGIPIFDRNQGGIALERATRTRLEHEYEARIARTRADVARLTNQDALLDSQIAAGRRTLHSLVPLEAAEHRGVESGDVDRLAWQEVRSTLLDLRLKLATLLEARLETRITLTTAVGVPDAVSPAAAGGEPAPSASTNHDPAVPEH
ncbi:MAG: TolC family protein [Acidobacteria bacterium]|nr:TolC family protein [Acidobacteriota bacterium]